MKTLWVDSETSEMGKYLTGKCLLGSSYDYKTAKFQLLRITA